MFTTRYHVAGMTCGNCVKHVTEELVGLAGVTDVNLVLEGDLVVMSDTELDFSDVEAAVKEAGDYVVTSA